MSVQEKERWLALCEQAAKEQDPKRLLELAAEINRLLEEREQLISREREAQSKPPFRQ